MFSSRSLRMRTASGAVAVVGGDRHQVDGGRDGDVPHEVGDEAENAAEDADQHRLLAGVVVAYLGAQLGRRASGCGRR